MRILHVVDSLEPGGMENGVVNIIRGLQPEIDGHVACLTKIGAFASRLDTLERTCALGKSNGFSPAVIWRLARVVRRWKPALLHTHNLGPLIYGAMATLFGKVCPILHGEHSLLTVEEKTNRRLILRRALYGACGAVHTVGPTIRNELLAYDCAHQNFSVIPNGVDTRRFVPGSCREARRHLLLPEDGTYIGIIGRFGREKGHLALLDAFDSLATQRPACHLLIVGGGGPLEAVVRERCEDSPFRKRIHCTGFMGDPIPAYQAINLLVIPSTNEGMANAALEAMACGVPVLGNTGCGHDAFIDSGSDGQLADMRNPTQLAKEISALLSSPGELLAMGARARAKVAGNFSIETMVDAYAALYRSFALQA